MVWTPGRTKVALALEEPYDDVPDHLVTPVWEWVEASFQYLTPQGVLKSIRPESVDKVAMHLRLRAADARQVIDEWRDRVGWDREFLLDLVEAVLTTLPPQLTDPSKLERLLTVGNSAYRVNPASDGLEYRITPGVRDAVAEAVATSTNSAGDHLILAWNAAYGRTTDPVRAYAEAVKAAEAALAEQVSPQNSKQTLGTMIRDVNSAPRNWEYVLTNPADDGVPVILAMMRSLWTNQSRHAGVEPTRPETAKEAQAAVQLAAALVQIGASGAFHRK